MRARARVGMQIGVTRGAVRTISRLFFARAERLVSAEMKREENQFCIIIDCLNNVGDAIVRRTADRCPR